LGGIVTISIDELSRLAGEDYRRKDEAKDKARASSDPFKKPKTEPGRARPNHGSGTSARRRMLTSLGGSHS
jgi:hypothetical protein